MKPRIALAATILMLVSLGLPPAELSARPQSLTAFVDDDWVPSERGGSYGYPDDPGYEYWIIEALQAADIEFDYLETQSNSGGEAWVPPLDTLRDYPLVIWNCAAEDDSPLSAEERQLLTDYMDLGGKVILLGQGIVNDLDLLAGQGDPDAAMFLTEILGLADYSLDNEFMMIEPDQGIPFMEGLDNVSLDYSALPDAHSGLSEILYPQNWMDTLLLGIDDNSWAWKASSDRYGYRPIHFQGFLLEAIGDPVARGAYLRRIASWLGFQGDAHYDFMNGPLDFSAGPFCPENCCDWSAARNAMVFSSDAAQTCESHWSKPLVPYSDCDWTVGFGHTVLDAGHLSSMVLCELSDIDGFGDCLIRISVCDGQAANYTIRAEVEGDGYVLMDRTATLDLATPYRTRIMLRHDQGLPELRCVVQTHNGFVKLDEVLTDFAPVFNQIGFHTVGEGIPEALPIGGFLDDIWFGGCLDWATTGLSDGVTTEPAGKLAAWPNPFNPKTSISYDLPRSGEMQLAIYDLSGRLSATLLSGHMEAGTGTASWDGRDDAGRPLPSGLYFARLRAPGTERVTKLVLMK